MNKPATYDKSHVALLRELEKVAKRHRPDARYERLVEKLSKPVKSGSSY